MKNTRVFLCACAVATAAACNEIDFDKISDSDFHATPSLVLPLAQADVTAGYLFEEAENSVAYYQDADNRTRIRIETNQDSIAAYGIFELLGLDQFESMGFAESFNLSDVNFDQLGMFGSQPIEQSFEKTIPLALDGFDVNSLTLNYSIVLNYSNFTHPATLTFDFGGNAQEVVIGDAQTGGSHRINGSGVEITPDAYGLPLGITLATTTDGGGHWGNLEIEVQLNGIDAIDMSLNDFYFSTNRYISISNLKDFKKLGGNINFRNPTLSLTYTNQSSLNYVMMAEMNAIGDDNLSKLDVPTILIAADEDYGKVDLNASNSNVGEFFNHVPDTIDFRARVGVTMPDGANSVKISKTDSLFLGYSYSIPVEFILREDLDPDTVQLDDIPDVEYITRAKLTCRVENSLPLEGSLVFTFLDEDTGQQLSEVDFGDVLVAPDLDSEGRATNVKTHASVVELTQQQVDDLGQSEAMLVNIKIKSPGDDYVVVTTDNILKINLSIAAEFDIE